MTLSELVDERHFISRHDIRSLEMKYHGIFWWVFATRGGFAILFALLLLYVGSMLGTLFFDPVIVVALGVLLGFYVLGNGILLGVSTVFAFERHLRLGWLLLCESTFAILLGLYIGFSLVVTPNHLALLAGIHALGSGCFQAVLACRVKTIGHAQIFIGLLAILALSMGVFFLLHRGSPLRQIAEWLSGFELIYGLATTSFAIQLRRFYIPDSHRVTS